jgi:hypothetical protein
MNIVDIIPSLRREYNLINKFIDNVHVSLELDDIQRADYIDKSVVLQRYLKESQKIIMDGVNFNIGNFDERGYVSSSDYDIANTLLQMGVGMPYPEFSLFLNIDVMGKKYPMILIIQTVEVVGVSYFHILPIFIIKEGKDISHRIHPSIVAIGTFQRGIDLDGGNDLSAFFDGGEVPEELRELFKWDLTTQVVESKFKERVTTYAFSYCFFKGDMDDPDVKDNGTDFMNYLVQEYIMKFLFLSNTRGVVTETVEAPSGLNKKRKKRGKLPIREYKVLKFHLPKEMKRHKSTRGDSVMPFHSVKGHTKVYGNERPLFGRYVGPVWCPNHFRGDEDHGVIRKDYKLTSRKGK